MEFQLQRAQKKNASMFKDSGYIASMNLSEDYYRMKFNKLK